jgi:hypothetical protein
VYIVEFKGQRWEGERYRVFSVVVEREGLIDCINRLAFSIVGQVVPVECLLGDDKQSLIVGDLGVRYVPH